MHAVGLHPIILRIDLHLRHMVVELHIPLPDIATILHRLHRLLQSIFLLHAAGERRLRYERDAVALGVEGAKHGAGEDGLHGGDGGVGVAHHGPGDDAGFEDGVGFGAEGGRGPDAEVGEEAGLDRADEVRHSLRDGRVDGVFRYVAFDAEV